MEASARSNHIFDFLSLSVACGKVLVCCFHTPKSCPLLLRLALLLVFGLCVWKWTTSGDILDANQDCSIGFGKSVGGIAQSWALTRKIGNRRAPKDYAVSILQREQTC